MLANTRDIRDAEEHLASLYAIRDYAALSLVTASCEIFLICMSGSRAPRNAEAPGRGSEPSARER